ncbi:MAG: radical SAM protein [Clostridiales bacterium]|jgi:nitrogen fixation protein NifB|nr:radical SAM protein [Clostridiales bacterium]
MLYDEKISQLHPCFGRSAAKKGRVHLPVSSSCNIQCRFCNRAFNESENRPGVASGLIVPEEADKRVVEALALCPDITVVGIAGPGDTLASDEALRAFETVHKKFPQLIKCISTNGLMLSEFAPRLKAAGVTTITVTVNAVDPEITLKIVSRVVYKGKRYDNIDGARLLAEKQLEGIRAVSEFAVIKVNTVLIPGVNDKHIGEVAQAVAAAGASMFNIIPLIPQHEFAGVMPPDCKMLDGARSEAERYITVFRHCQHCRADACGVPGISEFGARLYNKSLETFSHG